MISISTVGRDGTQRRGDDVGAHADEKDAAPPELVRHRPGA